jgi:hypothetical protein
MDMTPQADSAEPKAAYGGRQSLDRLFPIAAQRLRYEPDTGAFYWRHNVGRKIKAGQRAGRIAKNGYLVIGIDGTPILAHRLAFWIINGWCPPVLDHISGDPSDCCISNIRPAEPAENQRNSKVRADSSTGIRGVSIWHDKRGRRWYRAQIRHGGKTTFPAVCRDPLVAWVHRAAAAERIHGHQFMRESSSSGMPVDLIELIGDTIRERAERRLTPS